MRLHVFAILLLAAAIYFAWQLVGGPSACAETPMTESELFLWRAMVVAEEDAMKAEAKLAACDRKLAARSGTTALALTSPAPAAGTTVFAVRPVLAAGLVGLGLGAAATGAGLEQPDQRTVALAVGGGAVGLGLVLVAIEVIGGWL